MSINGERIKQAREIRGLTQEQLATRVGVKQPYISAIEQNIETPTEGMLEAIALATSFQTSFFERSSGPDLALGSLLYRRTRKLSRSASAEVRQMARVAVELVAHLARRFRQIPASIPRANCDPAQAAQLTRSAMGLSPDGPVSGLIRKLEMAGALVVYLPTEAAGFEAFSAWSDEEERRPVVCLKRSDAGDRVRRTVAHELGHLVLHQDFLGAEKERDLEADIFAGELLYPNEVMHEELPIPLTLTGLAEQKKRWGISMSAIVRYAEQRQFITARQKQYARKKLADRGWELREPVQIPVEYPRLLNQMVESLYPPGEAPRKIAAETGLSAAFAGALLDANRPAPTKMAPAGPGDGARLISFEERRRARA